MAELEFFWLHSASPGDQVWVGRKVNWMAEVDYLYWLTLFELVSELDR